MDQYKIELRMRNHNTMSRSALIDGLAKVIPQRHKVDLDDPEVFILVEVFKVRTAPDATVLARAECISEYMWHECC